MLELIVDASVALKWFPIEGESSIEESRRVWSAIQSGEIRAYTPLFMLVEVANVLARKKKVEAVVFNTSVLESTARKGEGGSYPRIFHVWNTI